MSLNKTILMIATIVFMVILHGCFTIITVTQPGSAATGEQIVVQIQVQLDATDDTPHYGIVGVMLPTSWAVDSVYFSGDVGPDYCTFLHPDSVDGDPGGQVDYWTDSLEARYPSPANMEWRVYQSSQPWNKPSTSPENWSVDLTINMTVGNQTGDFDLSYFVTDAAMDFSDPTWYSINEGNTITVGVIPVELVSFNSSVTPDGVKLNWMTATETNNQGFDIERSEDGTTFTKIGYVPGNGTSTEVHRYSFIDNSKFTGNNVVYYRLKQIDFDGTFTYSNVVNVDANGVNEFKLNQNYPNPFNPSTNIEYSLPVSGNVSLVVYDNLGKEVARLVNENKVAGNYNVEFDASNLPSGIYFYKLTSGKFSETKKMILLK